MKEQFVTHEIAEKIKELGFNEKCLAWFYPNTNYKLLYGYSTYVGKEDVINIPLWQQAIDFLRIKYNISVEPSVWVNTTTWVVRNTQTNETLYNTNDADYYNGRLKAVTKAIELIRKK